MGVEITSVRFSNDDKEAAGASFVFSLLSLT